MNGAEVINNGFDWVPQLIAIAQFGGAVTLVWYFITVATPRREKEHAAERLEWLAVFKALETSFNDLRKDHQGMSKEVETHLAKFSTLLQVLEAKILTAKKDTK